MEHIMMTFRKLGSLTTPPTESSSQKYPGTFLILSKTPFHPLFCQKIAMGTYRNFFKTYPPSNMMLRSVDQVDF